MRAILDLCSGTGEWSRPYSLKAREYIVFRLDLMNGDDVRALKWHETKVHGILAAPPCTHLAGSGARWWKDKGDDALLESLSIVDACLRAVVLYQPKWWCLENPVGRLSKYLGPPRMTFDPCDYGDPYTKRTCLWGKFNEPQRSPVPATEGSRMHLVPPGPDRMAIRSQTPAGFASAFFEANP